MFSLKRVFSRTALALCMLPPTLALSETNPVASPVPAASAALDGVALQGKIVETMNSSGYTYLLLDAAQGKVWIAIPETQVATGQVVTCAPGMTMKDFTSKTLNRTFESIVFSPGVNGSAPAAAGPSAPAGKPAEPVKTGAGFDAALQAEAGGKAAPGNPAEMTGPSTGSAGAVVPSSSDVNVNKATGENSYSVGECFEQGKDLHGKTVRVRGKVMKISRMIMGKNWLHIQDGTGNPLKNEHDLVVTTTEDPGEGGVVTVEGKLSAERDFGAGYKYVVIVEDAKVEK
jgi:hypothetical protein